MALDPAERARGAWHPSWLRLGVYPWDMWKFRPSELAATNAWLKKEAREHGD